MEHRFYKKGVRLLFIGIIMVILLFSIQYIFVFIYPFIIAFIISFLLNPFTTYLQHHWKMNRTIATLFIMSSFFAIICSFGFIFIKRLIIESSMLIESLPTQVQQIKILIEDIRQSFFVPLYEKIIHYIPITPLTDTFSLSDYVDQLIDEIGQSGLSILSNFIGTASNIVSSITYIVTIIIITLLASYMMTKDFNILKGILKKLMSGKVIHKIAEMNLHIKKSVLGFIKAQILLTMISSIIVLISLLILKVEHLLIITILIFFVDFIPFIGIGIIFIPWILYQFFTENFAFTIQLTIIYIIVIVVRQIFEPRILATNIGIHPLIALFILFVGIQSLGMIGIFLTPVVLILLSSMYHANIFHLLWNYVKNGK